MKRCNKTNNLSLDNKMPKLLAVTVLVLSLAMVTGCGKKDNTPATPSTDVKVETSVEAESTPEPTQEETVEPAETIPETETVEEVNLVEEIDCNKYMVMSDWIKDADYNVPKITVWSQGEAFMLSNGASYELSGNKSILVYVPGGVSNVTDFSCNFATLESDDWYVIPTDYLDLGKENEVTCNVTYKDGTQDTITVYITWKE